jgi:hypothetical protein
LKTPFLLSHAFPKELGSSTGQAQKIAHHVPRFWLVWLDCMDIQEKMKTLTLASNSNLGSNFGIPAPCWFWFLNRKVGQGYLIGGIRYTYPSEKYEFASWDDDIPIIWKVIKFHGSIIDYYIPVYPIKNPLKSHVPN